MESKSSRLGKWFSTALLMVDQLEQLRELVEITDGELRAGVEPLNWPFIKRIVRESSKQSRWCMERFEKMGLSRDDLPSFPDRDIVSIGNNHFNSALQACGWVCELWAIVGTELDIVLANHNTTTEIPIALWRFLAVLFPKATCKVRFNGESIDWDFGWVSEPLSIDKRISTAGILSELALMAKTEPLSTGTIRDKLPFSVDSKTNRITYKGDTYEDKELVLLLDLLIQRYPKRAFPDAELSEHRFRLDKCKARIRRPKALKELIDKYVDSQPSAGTTLEGID
jgi:hypothetical protein